MKGMKTLDGLDTNVDRIADLVYVFFKDDAKASLWFQTKNIGLGNITPLEMMAYGREEELLQYVERQLDENKRE